MDTLITSQEKMTDGQIAKVKELLEAALRRSGLDENGVQRVIEKGGNFQKRIIPVLQELGKLPYADEEVKSTYGYPKDWQLKSVSEQLAALQQVEYFKLLNATYVDKIAKNFSELPEGAEGLAIIPKPSKVASSYNGAVVLMTELMAKQRKDWYNYRRGCLGSDHLRLTDKTEQALAKLEKETPGDFLVIPVQTGLRHCGRSVRQARGMFSSNEWGLGPYEVGIILLVHPERLQKYKHLGIDCTGCEYSSAADGQFDDCLYFNWGGGRLGFSDGWGSGSGQDCGSASGFLR